MEKDMLWLPYQANLGGIIYRALCHHHTSDDYYCSNDTDDLTEPDRTDMFEKNGAAHNFTVETIIAVAIEAERLGLPHKQHSIVMAHIDTNYRDHRYQKEVTKYFIIDGERILISNSINGKPKITDFEKRYLCPPPELNKEKSGRVCNVCPFRPDIAKIYGSCLEKSIILKLRKGKCTSSKDMAIKIHGKCKFPNQYGL